MADKQPTLREIIEQVLDDLDGPITVKELADRVFAIRPTKAKTAMSSLRERLHYDEQGKNLVYLDKHTILPARIAMKGVRFRVPIDRHVEMEREVPVLFFEYFIDRFEKKENIHFMDGAGNPIPFQVRQVKDIWEPASFLRRDFTDAFDFSAWLSRIQPKRGDSLLATVLDWKKREFLLEYEPKHTRHIGEIQQFNKEFTELLFNILEESRDGDVFLHMVIPDVFARLTDPRGYPGDNWHELVEKDERMASDGIALRYPENISPLGHLMLPEDDILPWIKDSYDKKQAQNVYRFKVSLGFDSPVWRVIEIRAGQTFADLDRAIRQAFGHDVYDHMGGFWKLIPRGKSQKKYREVEIGDINPLGEGTASDLHIGGVDLKPGDRIKYVYDFGDWIEHEVTLEETATTQSRKRYPAVVARNKPNYQYCVICQSKGKETVATSVCLKCSTQKRIIFLCDDCASKKHMDHFVEDIIY